MVSSNMFIVILPFFRFDEDILCVRQVITAVDEMETLFFCATIADRVGISNRPSESSLLQKWPPYSSHKRSMEEALGCRGVERS